MAVIVYLDYNSDGDFFMSGSSNLSPILNEWRFVFRRGRQGQDVLPVQLSRNSVNLYGEWLYVSGKVSGHKKYEDGTEIATSRIIGIYDDAIMTITGSVYRLGTPDPKYVDEAKAIIAFLKQSLKPVLPVPFKNEPL